MSVVPRIAGLGVEDSRGLVRDDGKTRSRELDTREQSLRAAACGIGKGKNHNSAVDWAARGPPSGWHLPTRHEIRRSL